MTRALLLAFGLMALGSLPSAADEERFISVTPDACITVYETLVFTRRVAEVIVEADEIIAQTRHETLRERHGLEPNFLFFDQIRQGDYFLNSNTPEYDEQAVEQVAACDREHGFTPVATLGRREDLIPEFTCAVTFAIFARFQPEHAQQYSELGNYALQRHLAAATQRGDAVDPNQTLQWANQAVEERIARVQSGWELTEGLTADADACIARYRAEQAAAGQ